MPIKLTTFTTPEGQVSWGAVLGEGLVDLGARYGGSVLQLLNAGLVAEEVEARSVQHSPDFTLDDVMLMPPVVGGSKIICVGVNYKNRNAEYRDDSPDPEWPSLFMRAQESFTGGGQDLWRPPESEQLDYEGEIALVIGKPGHRIPQANAMDHIAGYTLMNEGTIRDWVRHAKFNVTQGKNFSRSGAIGPWMVTSDAVRDCNAMTLETVVNGELRQQDTTARLMFPFDYLVSYLSIFYTLQPGDIISTGTPNGAGARFDPPIFLAPGDIIEVSCPEIGTLRNGVIDDPEAHGSHVTQLHANTHR